MASIFLLRALSIFLASSQNEKLWPKNKVFKRSGMNFCRENDKNPVCEGDRSSKKKILLFLSYSTRVWWGTKALFLTSTIARTNSQIRGSIDKNLHSSPFVQKWPLRSNIFDRCLPISAQFFFNLSYLILGWTPILWSETKPRLLHLTSEDIHGQTKQPAIKTLAILSPLSSSSSSSSAHGNVGSLQFKAFDF